MKRSLYFVGVALLTLAAGAAGFFPVFIMGLVVPGFIVLPLALLTGSLLASLSAGWVTNFGVGGVLADTKSRIWAIFSVSLAASLAGSILAMVVGFIIDKFGADIGPNFGAIIYYASGATVFVGATTVATWRLRTPPTRRNLKRDATMSLLAVMITPVVIVGAIWLGCSFFYCGA